MPIAIPSRLSHSNRGRGLESLVETSQTTVRLSKVPHGVKHIGGGKTVAIRGLPDYFGIYIPTRQLIVFDCKMSAEANHLPTNDRVFPEHQRKTLWMYADAGAISGILAMRSAVEELYWVPFPMLVTRKPSIPWAEMVPLGSAKFAIRWERFCGDASDARGVEAIGIGECDACGRRRELFVPKASGALACSAICAECVKQSLFPPAAPAGSTNE